MLNRQEIWDRHYVEAIKLGGASIFGSKAAAENAHKQATDHANRVLAEQSKLFGVEETVAATLRAHLTEAEHRAALAEAECERLRKQLADQGEELSAAHAEIHDWMKVYDRVYRALGFIGNQIAGHADYTIEHCAAIAVDRITDRLQELTRLRADGVRLPDESRSHERALLRCAEAYEALAAALFDSAGVERPIADVSSLTIGYRTIWEPLINRARDIGTGALARELAAAQRDLAQRTDDYKTGELNQQKLEGLLDSLWETVHPGKEMADDLEPEEIARQICVAWAESGRKQLEKDRDPLAAQLALGKQVGDAIAAVVGGRP